MTDASLEQAMAAARREHVVPGRQIHMQDMRGYRFCEVGLITGTSQDNAVANIWNTTGVCDPTPEQVDALDPDTVARENGAVGAWLNPVRHWMADRLNVRESGADKTFGDVAGAWTGVTSAATLTATEPGSYQPGYLYRDNTLTFSEGSEVYLLDAPDGEVFIMQSFTRHQDPGLSEDKLAHLSRRLNLPSGWGSGPKYLTRTWRSRPTPTSWHMSCTMTCITCTRAQMSAGHSPASASNTSDGRHIALATRSHHDASATVKAVGYVSVMPGTTGARPTRGRVQSRPAHGADKQRQERCPPVSVSFRKSNSPSCAGA